jgi:hypothetical protein
MRNAHKDRDGSNGSQSVPRPEQPDIIGQFLSLKIYSLV